jgi:Caspase domain
LLDAMSGARFQLLILDACRDNAQGTKSGDKGLARRAGVGAGRMIAYATEEGKTAKDGAGANSPYAQSLAKHFANPRLSIVQALDEAAVEVRNNTNQFQQPMKSGDLAWNVQLNLASLAIEPVNNGRIATTSTTDPDEDAWMSAKTANTLPGYRAYLSSFPNGRFRQEAAQAVSRVQSMQGSQQSAELTNTLKFGNLPIQIQPAVLKPENSRTTTSSGSGIFASSILPSGKSDMLQSEVLLADSNGIELTRLKGPTNSIVSLVFDRSKGRLLGVQYGSDCFIWEIPSGSLIRKIAGPSNCGWSPESDDELIVTGRFGKVYTYNIRNENSVLWKNSDGHYVTAALSKNLLITRKGDDRWFWRKGPDSTPEKLTLPKDAYTGLSNEHFWVVNDKDVTIYSLSTSKKIKTFEHGLKTHGDFASFTVHPNASGTMLVLTMNVRVKTELQVWDVEKTQIMYSDSLNLSQDNIVVWFNNGNSIVLNGGYDKTGNNPKIVVIDFAKKLKGQAEGHFKSNPIISANGRRVSSPSGEYIIE